jgi:hypothetical protein
MFSANAVKPSSQTSLATAISLFPNPAFKCLSRTICVSDRRLRPPVALIWGWPHERAKLTTKVTTFLSKIKNDGLKALLYMALNEGFI